MSGSTRWGETAADDAQQQQQQASPAALYQLSGARQCCRRCSVHQHQTDQRNMRVPPTCQPPMPPLPSCTTRGTAAASSVMAPTSCRRASSNSFICSACGVGTASAAAGGHEAVGRVVESGWHLPFGDELQRAAKSQLCVSSPVPARAAHLVARLQMQVAHDGARKASGRPASGRQGCGADARGPPAAVVDGGGGTGGPTEQPPIPLRSPVLKSLEALKVLAGRGARRRRGLSAGLGKRRHSASGTPEGCWKASRGDPSEWVAPGRRRRLAGRQARLRERLQQPSRAHLQPTRSCSSMVKSQKPIGRPPWCLLVAQGPIRSQCRPADQPERQLCSHFRCMIVPVRSPDAPLKAPFLRQHPFSNVG